MPPKAHKNKDNNKTEPKPTIPDKKIDEQPRTRTRGRQLDKSVSKEDIPSKKIKKDESENHDLKKSTTQPKKSKNGDLSASKAKNGDLSTSKTKKDVSPSKQDKEPVKQPSKEAAKEQLKKIIMKGSAPVDQFITQPDKYKVFQEGGVVYAATLNQSNVQANNNKFYILQVLQNQSNGNFTFFTRWGRVGVPGQMAPIFCPNSVVAIRQYSRKLNEKLRGGYREVQMNYDDDDKVEKKEEKKEEVKKKDKKQQPQVQSSLDKNVQDLIKLIFDMKMMNNQMKEIGYDANKMPLGKLAKSSILRGYQALKGLMEQIKGKKRSDVIAKLSSDFYSQIPHNFGFQRMSNFILDTEVKVKTKLEMLQSLEDIQIFTKLLDQDNISDVNQLDSNYLKLSTSITSLDKNSNTFKLLLEYVQNTHASTHTAYKLEVLDIFQLSKDVENNRYRQEIDNKQLLWHGSRLTNFVGILSQGLRIAPPEAPVTGYMFGKGVYFADMVTKSANYCFTSKQNNIGMMLLCEVALGGMNEKLYADYYANLLPPGKFSTKGCGKIAPGAGKYIDSVYIPSGVGVATGSTGSLQYNEFIVYDVAQIKSKYLFKMRFNYR